MLIFFMLHGGGQAKGAAGTVLSTLENLARFHVALFSDLLACTSLTSLASLLDSRFQTLLGVYQSFLADFDRSLGWAGVLLTHAHTAEADQWAIVDAFVECIRQIEVYRWVVRMILEATPSPHAARNSLQSAARALHRVSVQAAMGEHLLALRQVARGIACSANSIHPMFTIVRLGRTVVQEGTLHLMDEGYQVPVVLVLFSNLLLILARGGGGMEVREICDLVTTSIESSGASDDDDGRRLVVWCAGVRRILYAGSVPERCAWAERLDATIAEACRACARAALLGALSASPGLSSSLRPPLSASKAKSSAPLAFSGPIPGGSSQAGAEEDGSRSGAESSDGEFEWAPDDRDDDESSAVAPRGTENGAAGVQGGVQGVEMIADRLRSVERQLRDMGSEAEMWGGGGHGETPSEGCQARLQRTILGVDDYPREFTLECDFESCEYHLTLNRLGQHGRNLASGVAEDLHTGSSELRMTCTRGKSDRAGAAVLRILSRSGKWVERGLGGIGGSLQGLLVERSAGYVPEQDPSARREISKLNLKAEGTKGKMVGNTMSPIARSRSHSPSRASPISNQLLSREWFIQVPGLPPKGSIRIKRRGGAAQDTCSVELEIASGDCALGEYDCRGPVAEVQASCLESLEKDSQRPQLFVGTFSVGAPADFTQAPSNTHTTQKCTQMHRCARTRTHVVSMTRPLPILCPTYNPLLTSKRASPSPPPPPPPPDPCACSAPLPTPSSTPCSLFSLCPVPVQWHARRREGTHRTERPSVGQARVAGYECAAKGRRRGWSLARDS